jgi:hypothetical protein
MKSSWVASSPRLPHATWPGCKKRDLKLHRVRYWLTLPTHAPCEVKVTAICALYQDAPALARPGEPVVSIDALTGV